MSIDNVEQKRYKITYVHQYRTFTRYESFEGVMPLSEVFNVSFVWNGS